MGSTLQEMDDKELYEQLEQAGLVERLENDPAWGMLREAGNRIVERAVAEFALRCDPTDVKHVTELKTIIKKYKFGLFNEVSVLKSESEQLYQEARNRGIFRGIFGGKDE